MLNYAKILLIDIETHKNINEVIKYLKKSVELGNSESMLLYGVLYGNGTYVKKDLNEAERYFKMAADFGNEIALMFYQDLPFASEFYSGEKTMDKYTKMFYKKFNFNLGTPEIEIDDESDIDKIKELADTGNSNAMLKYGEMLYNGISVKKIMMKQSNI